MCILHDKLLSPPKTPSTPSVLCSVFIPHPEHRAPVLIVHRIGTNSAVTIYEPATTQMKENSQDSAKRKKNIEKTQQLFRIWQLRAPGSSLYELNNMASFVLIMVRDTPNKSSSLTKNKKFLTGVAYCTPACNCTVHIPSDNLSS